MDSRKADERPSGSSKTPGRRRRKRSRSRSPPAEVTRMHKMSADVLAAIDRATGHFKLCPNRVWAVAASLSGKEANLPMLIPSKELHWAREFEPREDHSQCTFALCEHSRRDFTAVPQRHEPPCGEYGRTCVGLVDMFPRDALDHAANNELPTAWSLEGKKMVKSSSGSHMAISHVWGDGTGTGAWSKGQVNDCLWYFFRGVAQEHGCEGIWWDAICIPSQKAARAKAIVKIQQNYENARITLVHDCFLRNWVWTDPETACFAIVMSPWFSRGWTALELAKSRNVKVLFKAPGIAPGHVVKDLDNDILDKVLLNDTPGHPQIAARAIVKLRSKEINKVDDLLTVLGPRYTSWPRDVAVISGLLVGVDMSGGVGQQGIYQRILIKMGEVSRNHLFHGLPTMSKSEASKGGFTWCATSLLDLPLSSEPGVEVVGSGSLLRVETDGGVVGPWVALRLDSMPDNTYIWTEMHPLMKARLQFAIADKKKHLFLLEPYAAEIRRCLLVKIMQKEAAMMYVPCEFVGSINFHEVGSASTWDRSGKARLEDTFMLDFKIGGTESVEEIEGEAWGLLVNWREEILAQGAGGVEAEKSKGIHGAVRYTNNMLQSASANGDREAVAMLLKKNVNPNGTNTDGWTALHRAAWWGHADVVKLLIDGGAKSDIVDRTKQLALHIAAEQENEAVVKILLSGTGAGANPNSKREDGQTVLHRAVWGGSASVIDLLLSNDSTEIDATDNNGMTALHMAAGEDDAQAADQLLRAGARSDIQGRWKSTTALHYAITKGSNSFVERMVREAACVEVEEGLGKSTPLQIAILEGNTTAAELLLHANARVDNYGSGSYDTPLVLAIDRDNLTITRLLLEEKGADLRGGNPESYGSPIQSAISRRNPEMIKLLADIIGIECFLNDKNNYGGVHNHLELAIQGGDEEMVVMLLNAGADVNTRDKSSRSNEPMLYVAAAAGQEKIVKLLLERGAEIAVGDCDALPPLLVAASRGHEGVVKFLLSTGKFNPDQRAEDGSALYYAARSGHVNVVKLLLDTGAVDVCAENRYGETPLIQALRGRYTAVIQLLIDSGKVDLNPEHSTYWGGSFEYSNKPPLHYEASQGCEDMAKLLLENGADIKLRDWHGRTPLWYAIQSKSLAVTKLILERGEAPDIGSGGKEMLTPVMLAVMLGLPDILKLLLEYGADAKERDINGRTPLWHAAKAGNLPIVELLAGSLGEACNFNDKDWDGYSPLFFAAERGDKELVRLILKAADVDVNSKVHKDGQTPLLVAIRNKHRAVAALLLDTEKINVDLEDHKGSTPLLVAVEAGDEAMVRLLLEKGGSMGPKGTPFHKLLRVAQQHRHKAVVDLLLGRSEVDNDAK